MNHFVNLASPIGNFSIQVSRQNRNYENTAKEILSDSSYYSDVLLYNDKNKPHLIVAASVVFDYGEIIVEFDKPLSDQEMAIHKAKRALIDNLRKENLKIIPKNICK